MPKSRKSNKEVKKKPVLTMKEKRAAKNNKNEDKLFLGSENAAHRPATASGAKRS